MSPPPCLSISLIMEEDECDYVATEKEIRECELDIVAGEKVDSLWLILDNKYILIRNRPFKDGKAVWECRGRRHHDLAGALCFTWDIIRMKQMLVAEPGTMCP